eukprot:scaffold21049_cov122-Skeletonema_dohrnii-CCMP3373.AAC.1
MHLSAPKCVQLIVLLGFPPSLVGVGYDIDDPCGEILFATDETTFQSPGDSCVLQFVHPRLVVFFPGLLGLLLQGHVAANPVYGAVGGMFYTLRSQRLAPARRDVHCSKALADFPQHIRWINDNSFPPIPLVKSGLQTLAAMYGDCVCKLERHESNIAASLVANMSVGWYGYMLPTSQEASKDEVMRRMLVNISLANNKK